MNPIQISEIVERGRRMKLSHGELMQLAREAAQDCRLSHWRHLSKEQAHDLIESLDRIERDEQARAFRRRERELVGAR